MFPPHLSGHNFFAKPGFSTLEMHSGIDWKSVVYKLPAVLAAHPSSSIRTYSHSRNYSTEIFLIDFLPTTPLPPFSCIVRMLLWFEEQYLIPREDFPALISTKCHRQIDPFREGSSIVSLPPNTSIVASAVWPEFVLAQENTHSEWYPSWRNFH